MGCILFLFGYGRLGSAKRQGFASALQRSAFAQISGKLT